MENAKKKKHIISIVILLTIFAVMIGVISAISVNYENAYADSSNGVVNANLLEKSNFYETNKIDTNKYVIVSANCSFENINFKNERADGYGAFLYDINEYGNQLQTYTITMNMENVNATTVRIGVGSYSPLSLRYVTNYTSFTNNLVFSFTLATELNNAHLYFAINAGGEIKINWLKMEIGNTFTGYVPNSYSNYGYNQGIITGNNEVYEVKPNLLYNGDLNPNYSSQGQYTKTEVIDSDHPNTSTLDTQNIPFWWYSGQAIITNNRNENNVNSLSMNFSAQINGGNYNLNDLHMTTEIFPVGGLYENNENYYNIEPNTKYTISIRATGNKHIKMEYWAVNDNGSPNEQIWTGVDYQTIARNEWIQTDNNVIYATFTTGSLTNVTLIRIELSIMLIQDESINIEYIKLEKGESPTPNKSNLYATAWYSSNGDYRSGYTQGYAKGYNDGQQDRIENYENLLIENGNRQYKLGYDNGYSIGQTQGYNKGKVDGDKLGYDRGKADGIVEGRTDGTTWSGLFGAVFDAPVKIIFGTQNANGTRVGGLLNFNLPLGNQSINLYQFATALFTILLACAVIKIVVKIIL